MRRLHVGDAASATDACVVAQAPAAHAIAHVHGSRAAARRTWLARAASALVMASFAPYANALTSSTASPDPDALSPQQSAAFRAWFTRIVDQQMRRGPTPRWTQRDCAGLVRFAVGETLKPHDSKWLRANGMTSLADASSMPPELQLSASQRTIANRWTRVDGSTGAYASAIALIQRNSRFVSKDVNQALPGDLLFFDQGDDQHLMIWLDRYIAYHTGTVTPTDTGLRAVAVSDLMQWKDSRWQPLDGNPNFVGVFRLDFLTP
ncbi:DUF1175 domain-containing protein [Paraburkholderia fungorum]|uniref:DUF1175 domain-containing protein n=1 Tax=Paraburkholderia fungorum TaxID=134537 RepID=UPI0020920791|nr:DUF1175 family protein [Paraburkholderia fungorum]USU19076.1 DUF1175 family protein [Paraburkholderia fungorum]USU28928.1 DUF1175 family protein [Paraburkholderia fungorum]